MRKITVLSIIVILFSAFTFWLFSTDTKVDTEPIELRLGDVITASCGSKVYEIIAFDQSNGRDLVCYKSLNGETFITNFGDPNKSIVEGSDYTCSDKSIFVTTMYMKSQKIQ